MTTIIRKCLTETKLTDSDGKVLVLKKDREYITSEVDEKGNITVFTNYWVNVPADIFDCGKRFT